MRSELEPRARIDAQDWGTADGQPVELWTLRNQAGIEVAVATYGGVVQAIQVPDAQGEPANVVLGFATLEEYVNDFEHQPWPQPGGSGSTYFGAIVGRFANRIADHSFTLDGERYELPGNNGPDDIHTMHGGPRAWSVAVWEATPESGEHSASLQLRHVDPDGANGFPGEVTATVTYTLTDYSALRIDYHAHSSARTVLNLTNHSYFNLAGEGSGDVYGHLLQINAGRFLPADATMIPTGEFAPVTGTPFDFRAPKPIGRDLRRTDQRRGEQLALAHGYDHTWVLDGSGLRLAAVAQDLESGRELVVYTTEPGVQLYTGNFLVGDLVGPSGRAYRQGDGFALETQHYPDSPHHLDEPGWPSVLLEPGRSYQSATIYRFGLAGGQGLRPG